MQVIQVRIIGPKGVNKIIDLCGDEKQLKTFTVGRLKAKIKQKLTITDDFRLVFRTETLEDSRLLVIYNIKHMSTVHVVLTLDGGLGGGP